MELLPRNLLANTGPLFCSDPRSRRGWQSTPILIRPTRRWWRPGRDWASLRRSRWIGTTSRATGRAPGTPSRITLRRERSCAGGAKRVGVMTCVPDRADLGSSRAQRNTDYAFQFRVSDPSVFTNRISKGDLAIPTIASRTASRCVGLMSQFLEFGTMALGTLSNAALPWRNHASPMALVFAISLNHSPTRSESPTVSR